MQNEMTQKILHVTELEGKRKKTPTIVIITMTDIRGDVNA